MCIEALNMNSLENGVEIDGTITFEDNMTLDCVVNGEIKTEKGSLIMDPNSKVNGDIKANDVTIKGKVEGSIEAQSCKLQGTADVQGDLAYKSLGMEPGAKMVGSTKILS